MKQVLESLDGGVTELAEVPVPTVKPGHVVVWTRASVVSAGTERMLVEFGRASLLEKARRQPDRVRQALDKVKTDGLVPTIEAVRERLDRPVPLGCANAGVVLEVGEGVRGFQVGAPVVSNGPHAEVVCVPANLCARIPQSLFDRVRQEQDAFEQAAFTVLGAVALEGIRLASPGLGETFAVTGLGLIGLLVVQILRAHGCRVFGIDLKADRVGFAEQFGARGVDLSKGVDPVAAAMEMTAGRGVDGVVLTAATASNEPVHQAAQMCRKRGRIILVGVSGLELRRGDFYEKELTFQVSCAYGPGRYDPEYEGKGHDYPYGYVRWTAQRNFEAVLQLIAEGKLDVAPLISQRVPLAEAPALYNELARGNVGVGLVLTYPRGEKVLHHTVRLSPAPCQADRPIQTVVGVIGAGSFATRTILPLIRESGVRCKLIASRGGADASRAGRRFGFEEATSDSDSVLADKEINTVFIVTPHSSHAELTCRALEAGRHVFVEKPLAIAQDQLERVKASYDAVSRRAEGAPVLHVGFNRRFSPYARRMKELLARAPGPKSLMVVVNAGQVDAEHWALDPEVGGGRIVGEAGHFIDLLRFLVGSPIVAITSARLGGGREETVSITLSFADGSLGCVHYWGNGHRAYPKERLEVFAGGHVLVLDNFRRLSGYGWPGFKGMRSLWRQDKGHRNEVREFLARVQCGGPPLIPFDELVEVTEATLQAAAGP